MITIFLLGLAYIFLLYAVVYTACDVLVHYMNITYFEGLTLKLGFALGIFAHILIDTAMMIIK